MDYCKEMESCKEIESYKEWKECKEYGMILENKFEKNPSDANEFCSIIELLVDTDLSILYNMLMLEDELEQKIYLRKMRAHTTFDGTVYNAFCARVLVYDPIDYVKNEIICRFNKVNKIN